ncbi:cysteine hydrolase family protein [Chloroflexota bacterium]
MDPTWRKNFNKLFQMVPTFQLNRQKTALMVIDMQYAGAHPDYGLGIELKEKYPEMHSYYYGRLAQIVVPNHIKLLGFFRKNGLRIVYLTIGSRLADLSDLTPLRRQRSTSGGKCWVGSSEYNILEAIKPQEDELVMLKTAGNAFSSSSIDQALRNMGIECLVVTGTWTFACVLTTACDAADRGYKTIIVEDAVAGIDQEHHDAALRIFASIYGRVASTDEVCTELES